MHLRNAPTKLMKELGHGSGYRYDHDHGGFSGQEGLPESLIGHGSFFQAHPTRARDLRIFAQPLGQQKRLTSGGSVQRASESARKVGWGCNLHYHVRIFAARHCEAMCKPI